MKFKSKSIASFWVLLCFCHFGNAQIYNNEVEGKIILEARDGFIDVTGSAKNKSEINQSLRYELSVIRSNSGNTSKNAQSGRFTLEPNELKKLSQTSINNETGDRIIILLLIYDMDENLVGKDRYVLNEKKEVEAKAGDVVEFSEEKEKSEDGIVLRGIVTEETKTKAGKDFFKHFYSSYMSNRINADKIVTIKEMINMGRSTRIAIEVDNEVVFQFFVQPKDDYLRTMADAAIKRVARHLEREKRTAENIRKY